MGAIEGRFDRRNRRFGEVDCSREESGGRGGRTRGRGVEEERGERIEGGGGGVVGEETISDNSIISVVSC